MKRLKYLLLALLILPMAFGFAACAPAGESEKGNTGEEETPNPTPPVTKDTSLVVMSYNLDQDGGNKSDKNQAVLGNILEVAPDLLGVQEETTSWLNFLEDAMEVEGYAHVVTFRGGPAGYDEASGIFYKIDRFTLKDSGTFWLSETPDRQSIATSWGAIYPRVCTWVILTDKRTGKDVAYFNTHFSYENTTCRTESAKLITARIQAAGLPAFFTGDLNFASERAAEQETYQVLTNALSDSRTAATDTMSGCTFHNYGQKPGETITGSTDTIANVPIDYIFSTKGDFTATKFAILTEDGPAYSSDHFAVYAKFEYASAE